VALGDGATAAKNAPAPQIRETAMAAKRIQQSFPFLPFMQAKSWLLLNNAGAFSIGDEQRRS